MAARALSTSEASRNFEVLSGQLVAPSLFEAVLDLVWPQYGVDDVRTDFTQATPITGVADVHVPR